MPKSISEAHESKHKNVSPVSHDDGDSPEPSPENADMRLIENLAGDSI